jgi:acetylornithine deacetylase/succinyl-diaminopimelate desuccinylase-like protein
MAQTETSVKAKDSFREEIKALTRQRKVVSAFQIIDQLEPATLRDHVFLTEIPAPPFKEKERGLAYKKMLEEAGADQVWIDSVGNVLALRKGVKGSKTIALDAHLDTVFPEGTDVKVKRKGDTLLAPGILDDTRGLAVVLTVLRALEKAGIETQENILLVGSVGEEGPGDLRGVKALFKKGAMPIDSWISADGGGGTIGQVVNAGVGSIRYRVTAKGPGGHSYGSFGLGNPHHLLARAIHYFDEEAGVYTSQGIKTTYNVGRIGGGTSINSIPFESWMEVDMRSEDPARLKAINDIFLKAIDRASKEYNSKIKQGPPLTVDIKQIGFRPSGKTDANHPIVQQALAAADYFKAETFLEPESTNANIPISKGVPAVTLNLGGNGGNPHSLNEWWVNEKGSEAIKMILLVLLAQTGIN